MRAFIGFAGTAFLIGISANVASSEKSPVPLEFTVAEDAAPGAVIGRVVADASAATYSVVHEGRAVPFVVDRQTGELTLTDSRLDYEAQTRHEFIVRSRRPRAIDNARRAYLADLLASGVDSDTMDDLLFETVEQQVAVLVTDAPERPVLAPSPLQIQFGETGEAKAAQVVANDPDSGDALTYELLSDDVQPFEIDPQSGRLTYRNTLAAVAGSHPVTIRVTDSTGLSDVATFNVDVVIATPTVASGAPEVVPAEQAATSEPLDSAVTVVPGTNTEDPESIIVGSDSVVVVPESSSTTAEPVGPETFVEPEPDTDPEVAVTAQHAGKVATPMVAAAVDGTRDVSPEDDAGVVAGGTSSRGILHWLPLIPVVAGVVFAGVWYWRRRQERLAQESRGPFRVVRELPDAATSAAPKAVQPSIESIDDLLEPRGLALETDHADQAAVRELMATAFQQASGLPAAHETLPSATIAGESEPVVEADSPDVEAIASMELTAGPLAGAHAFVDEPALESAYGFDAAMQAESRLDAMPVDAAEGTGPGFGTEPYAMPYPEPAAPVGATSIEAELEAAHASGSPIPTVYGYGAEDEELAGGYQGLRLSHTSGPAPADEPAPPDFGPIETQELNIAGTTSNPSSPENDPKLQELRRQLSDLFGVPADKPRAMAPPVYDEEPLEEEAAISEAVAEAPAPIAPPSPPAVMKSPMPAAPAASLEAAAPAVPAPASDPVNSWLEYLKQRALEKPGSQPAPAAPIVQPHVPKAPSKPALSAAAIAAARKPVTPPPVRPNKSAVREEITMLRDLANRHSRNVLARRALTQKARMTWVLWGTALIVLCFSALWGVRHDAGGVRTLGWALLGGAAIALGCCVYGFRSLTRRPLESLEDEELDATRLADDLESSAAPELMTPEMEQRLRAVLEEARNVPEPVQSR